MLAIWTQGPMTKSYAELGATLRAARHSKGWRQDDLAERSGGRLKQTYISKIESGDHRPEFKKLEAFAETLGLNLNELKILAGYPVVTITPDTLVVNPHIPTPTVTPGRSGVTVGTRIDVRVEPSHEQLLGLWSLLNRKLPPDEMTALMDEVVESLEGTEQEDR